MVTLRLLLSIWLAAAAVRAEATWAVDPGQALLTVDGAAFSAFSHRVTGRLLEQEDGAVRVELRMPLESLVTGSATQARRVPRDGELLFDLVGTGAATDGSLELEGTLTIRGVTQPVRITLVLARLNAMTFGHATIVAWPKVMAFKRASTSVIRTGCVTPRMVSVPSSSSDPSVAAPVPTRSKSSSPSRGTRRAWVALPVTSESSGIRSSTRTAPSSCSSSLPMTR